MLQEDSDDDDDDDQDGGGKMALERFSDKPAPAAKTKKQTTTMASVTVS